VGYLKVNLCGVLVRAVAEVQAINLVWIHHHLKVREGSNTGGCRSGKQCNLISTPLRDWSCSIWVGGKDKDEF
jgi:hypothetical protein